MVRTNPKFKISVKEMQDIISRKPPLGIGFKFLNGDAMAFSKGFKSMWHLERAGESPEHKRLQEASVQWFIDNAFRVNQRPLGIKTQMRSRGGAFSQVFSDLNVVDADGNFYFVEVLTYQSSTEKRISRKMILSRYAPLIYVISKATYERKRNMFDGGLLVVIGDDGAIE